jgi:23S rRNA (cytidine1920-2'-O)/16S rRNA (cytidine1409-2'-O)-methyltransferase
MVRRGMAATRSEAAGAIHAGKVIVAGRPAAKAGTLVDPSDPIVLSGPARPFVSRGGEKLAGALDGFELDVRGRRALDAGASTGGFTDCLLARGAAHVVAVDVGYGQLDWSLRGDPRVTVMERTNARELAPSSLPYPPTLVTADLSFIALRTVVPALVRCSAPRGEFVLLVKPQFEAGRDHVSGGVVRDPEVWRRAIESVAAACAAEGLTVVGAMASQLLGPSGNAEFFLHSVRSGRPGMGEAAPSSFESAIVAGRELASLRDSKSRAAGR